MRQFLSSGICSRSHTLCILFRADRALDRPCCPVFGNHVALRELIRKVSGRNWFEDEWSGIGRGNVYSKRMLDDG